VLILILHEQQLLDILMLDFLVVDHEHLAKKKEQMIIKNTF